MSRRIALPGADELFRSTGDGDSGGRNVSGREQAGEVVSPLTRDGATRDAREPARGREAREATREALSEKGRPAELQEGAADLQPASVSPASPPSPMSSGDTDGLEEASDSVRSTSRRRPRAVADRRPSGRERHDEKITVYVSPDELMDLEHARLMLRGDHGLPVDRGRVVREALAVVLADFEAKGEASILVRRLRGR